MRQRIYNNIFCGIVIAVVIVVIVIVASLARKSRRRPRARAETFSGAHFLESRVVGAVVAVAVAVAVAPPPHVLRGCILTALLFWDFFAFCTHPRPTFRHVAQSGAVSKVGRVRVLAPRMHTRPRQPFYVLCVRVFTFFQPAATARDLNTLLYIMYLYTLYYIYTPCVFFACVVQFNVYVMYAVYVHAAAAAA